MHAINALMSIMVKRDSNTLSLRIEKTRILNYCCQLIEDGVELIRIHTMVSTSSVPCMLYAVKRNDINTPLTWHLVFLKKKLTPKAESVAITDTKRLRVPVTGLFSQDFFSHKVDKMCMVVCL